MPEPDKEYRVVSTAPDNPSFSEATRPTESQKEAGDARKRRREYMRNNGVKGTVDIESREVSPWKLVERSTVE
jgi:hypothetical protein